MRGLLVLAVAAGAGATPLRRELSESLTRVPPPADVEAPPDFAQRTTSGLAYTVLRPGFGHTPSATSTVLVDYTGWTTDGQMFDTSGSLHVTFPVDRVIQGWAEGLQLMREGEQTRFWIPPGLAYGNNPGGGRPAGMLVFDVTLLGVCTDDVNVCVPVDVPAPAGVESGDSCVWANDGECDVPQFCEDGTDSTDCASASSTSTTLARCAYTDDGECDEVDYCPAGTDTIDCCPEGSTPQTKDAYCGSISGYPDYVPVCQFADDDECDEDEYCEPGTDTGDCCPSCPDGGCTPRTPFIDCSGVSGYTEFVAPTEANHGTFCAYTNDGECDETEFCPRGSDTVDCCSEAKPECSDRDGCDPLCPIGTVGENVDECGCPSGTGWSETTGTPCCKPGSITQDSELASCQNAFGNTDCAGGITFDACGCPAGFGWSTTTGRGCCKLGSVSQPQELESCQLVGQSGNMDCDVEGEDGLQDHCGCPEGFGWSISTGRPCCKAGSLTSEVQFLPLHSFTVSDPLSSFP